MRVTRVALTGLLIARTRIAQPNCARNSFCGMRGSAARSTFRAVALGIEVAEARTGEWRWPPWPTSPSCSAVTPSVTAQFRGDRGDELSAGTSCGRSTRVEPAIRLVSRPMHPRGAGRCQVRHDL